jgi:cytidyltransferase-like protein
MKKYDAVITSGYFDPIHVGHIEYLRKAKELGQVHLVIVNNDGQAKLKKGRSFMPEGERLEIVKALACVDEAIPSLDEDETVRGTLAFAFFLFSSKGIDLSKVAFCKGGDRFTGEIPEAEICRKFGVDIVDGLGDKIQSSSRLTGLSRDTIARYTAGQSEELS